MEESVKKSSTEKGFVTTPMAIIIAGFIIAGAIILTNTGTTGGQLAAVNGGNGDSTLETTGPSEEELRAKLVIQEDDHVRGSRNAPIYIVEYSDTECPFCKRFHNTMKQVLAEYGDEVAWVYRHWPIPGLHPTAPREAEMLECANELGGGEAFWQYTDLVYERTPSGAAFTDDQLFDLAQEIGLDREAFISCVNSGKYAEKIAAQAADAPLLGGRGTPHSLIIMGEDIAVINGAQEFPTVKAQIEAMKSRQQ